MKDTQKEEIDKLVDNLSNQCGITDPELQNKMLFSTTTRGNIFFKEAIKKVDQINPCAAKIMQAIHDINDADPKAENYADKLLLSRIADKSSSKGKF